MTRVFISAGHHDAARGASHEGFSEFPETQEWQRILLSLFPESGVLVPPTKLGQKIDFVNMRAERGDVAVEVHFNAGGSLTTRGCETLYCPGSTQGFLLAYEVQGELARVFPPSRGVKEGWYQMDRAKGADAFLRDTLPVAIIVEPEFIHHRSMIQGFREEGVRAIAAGIRTWLSTTAAAAAKE